MATKKRIQSLAAVVLAVLTLLSISPVAAFAATTTTRPATTTTVPTATVYCYKHPSCQGRHPVNNCPGPQRLTRSTSKVTVNNVQHTVTTIKPTTISATTVTVTSSNRYNYTYIISADNKTITERKYDKTTQTTTTRTANVDDYVDANAPSRTTKSKKDGKFGYQAINTTQMKIWVNDGTKTTITRNKDNQAAYDGYWKAIDAHISAHNTAVMSGVGLGAALAALAAIYFINPALGAVASAEVIKAVIGVSAAAGTGAIAALTTSVIKSRDNYQLARKYYYELKG